MAETANFTEKVRRELASGIPNSRHCRLAELGAIISLIGRYDGEKSELVIFSENELVLKITEKLLNKIFSVDNTFNIIYDIKRSGKELGRIVLSRKQTEEVLKAVKLNRDTLAADPVLYTMTCCKRSYLRGAFLGAGSLTDPNKDYHFEISVPDSEKAEELKNIISSFDADAKTVIRKKQYVVYVKDSGMISDILNVMGAPISMMELENVKILKDVRNRVNRQVNCDAANIKKSVAASGKQLEDIALIRKVTGFEGIPAELKETAILRESYPEASLAELVVYNGEKIGKSGLNHRLKRLSAIADKLRSESARG